MWARISSRLQRRSAPASSRRSIAESPFWSTTCASAVINVPTPLPYMCCASSAGRAVGALAPRRQTLRAPCRPRSDRSSLRQKHCRRAGCGTARRRAKYPWRCRSDRPAELARRRRAADVEIDRVDPARHRLAGATVAGIANLDAAGAKTVESFEPHSTWQLVQFGADRSADLVQIGDMLRSQPARAEQGVDVVGQRDGRCRDSDVLVVAAPRPRRPSAAWRMPPAGVRRARRCPSRHDLVGVVELVGADDGLQVDAIAIGDIGQRVARADGVQDAIGRRDEHAGRPAAGPGSSRSLAHSMVSGRKLVLLGDLPQHFAGGDGVLDGAVRAAARRAAAAMPANGDGSACRVARRLRRGGATSVGSGALARGLRRLGLARGCVGAMDRAGGRRRRTATMATAAPNPMPATAISQGRIRSPEPRRRSRIAHLAGPLCQPRRDAGPALTSDTRCEARRVETASTDCPLASRLHLGATARRFRGECARPRRRHRCRARTETARPTRTTIFLGRGSTGPGGRASNEPPNADRQHRHVRTRGDTGQDRIDRLEVPAAGATAFGRDGHHAPARSTASMPRTLSSRVPGARPGWRPTAAATSDERHLEQRRFDDRRRVGKGIGDHQPGHVEQAGVIEHAQAAGRAAACARRPRSSRWW